MAGGAALPNCTVVVVAAADELALGLMVGGDGGRIKSFIRLEKSMVQLLARVLGDSGVFPKDGVGAGRRG